VINPLRRTPNVSPSDIADEIARATNANLVQGLECIALAMHEASFQVRQFVHGDAEAGEVILAMQLALDQLEHMVHCRAERALLRRLIEEMDAYVIDAYQVLELETGPIVANEMPGAGESPCADPVDSPPPDTDTTTDQKEATS